METETETETVTEDPRGWGAAEQVVYRALSEPAEERPEGQSVTRSITEALRGAGLLMEEAGTDTVEYGVRKNEESDITVPNSNTLGYGTMATAQELADKFGDTIYVRERTTYEDRVSEWRAVGGPVPPPEVPGG